MIDVPSLDVKKYRIGFVSCGVSGEGDYPVVHRFDAKTDTLCKFLINGKKFSVTPILKKSMHTFT